jgi:hypothetical protein
MLHNLQSLTKVKPRSDLEDYFTQLDEEVDWIRLPFRWSSLRIVNEPIRVIGGIVRPVPSAPLLKYITETPEHPILVTDPGFEAKDSLFFALLTEDIRIVDRWLQRMTWPSLHVNNRRGDYLVAAPVKAFIA